ncbi:ornithine carbamoyltransferase subunit F, partial [Candidatus Erwinia dacicola]|nr:ornithine carbamoyltransferase subunit F [Candidatus Erwinia dacicola]
LTYVGDTHNNMGNTLLEAAALMGIDLRLAAPESCWPDAELIAECCKVAEKTGGKITLTADIHAAVKGADFIYTDVWVSPT